MTFYMTRGEFAVTLRAFITTFITQLLALPRATLPNAFHSREEISPRSARGESTRTTAPDLSARPYSRGRCVRRRINDGFFATMYDEADVESP